MAKYTFNQKASMRREEIYERFAPAYDSPLAGAARVNPERLAEIIYKDAKGSDDAMKALAMTGAQRIANRVANNYRRHSRDG